MRRDGEEEMDGVVSRDVPETSKRRETKKGRDKGRREKGRGRSTRPVARGREEEEEGKRRKSQPSR